MKKVTKKELFERSNEHELRIYRIEQALKQSGVEWVTTEPQLKQLDQSVFDGLDAKWRFAAVCNSGKAIAAQERPKILKDGYFIEEGYLLLGLGYDTTNWQNSLIERKELTGSDLCRAMLARGDKFVMCGVNEDSQEDTMLDGFYAAIESVGKDNRFYGYPHYWNYATPINNQGEPLTQSDVGL